MEPLTLEQETRRNDEIAAMAERYGFEAVGHIVVVGDGDCREEIDMSAYDLSKFMNCILYELHGRWSLAGYTACQEALRDVLNAAPLEPTQ